MLKSIKENQKGMVAIVMTAFILASILVITMIANTIILNNLSMNTTQNDAIKAFFASEAGAENIMYQVRKEALDFSVDGINCIRERDICFNSPVSGYNSDILNPVGCVSPTSECGSGLIKNVELPNKAKYTLRFLTPSSGATEMIKSYGEYLNTVRNTQVEY